MDENFDETTRETAWETTRETAWDETTLEAPDRYAGTRYIDTYQLGRSQGRLAGCLPLRGLTRLLCGLGEQDDVVVRWSVQGEANGSGMYFLLVRVKACLQLECQRCLGPVAWPIDTRTRLQLVSASALEADVHDLDAQEDMVERIADSHRLDVQALVEDELILGLPYVPMHEKCPSLSKHAASEPGDDEKRPSPFAVLGNLKH